MVRGFLLLFSLVPASAQEDYGAKGIYPVYETAGQWVIFDKNPGKRSQGAPAPLTKGARLLVIGSRGADIFAVARSSATYGGACKDKKPARLRAALLKGPLGGIGSPIIGIRVPETFSLKGSRAKYHDLANTVGEDTYSTLGEALKSAQLEDVKSGAFRFKLDDNPGPDFLRDPKPEAVLMKIDFGARLPIRRLAEPFFLVEGTQIMSTYRRCLRLADGAKLIGGCALMPNALMAETALLRFVAYDPSGEDSPYLLAYTPAQPLWGHERWGFILRDSGPRLFLLDSMDVRCREAF